MDSLRMLVAGFTILIFSCRGDLDHDQIQWSNIGTSQVELKRDWTGLDYTYVKIDGKRYKFLIDSGS